jgi:hypothetical protein
LNEGERQTEDEEIEVIAKTGRGKRGGLSLFGLGDLGRFLSFFD